MIWALVAIFQPMQSIILVVVREVAARKWRTYSPGTGRATFDSGAAGKPTYFFFGLLVRFRDSLSALARLEVAAGALGFACFGFLVSRLLRFWPLAMVFASPASTTRDRLAAVAERAPGCGAG